MNNLGFIWDINASTVKRKKLNQLDISVDEDSRDFQADKERRIEEKILKKISSQKDDKNNISVRSNKDDVIDIADDESLEPLETESRDSRSKHKFEFSKMFEPSSYREIAGK